MTYFKVKFIIFFQFFDRHVNVYFRKYFARFEKKMQILRYPPIIRTTSRKTSVPKRDIKKKLTCELLWNKFAMMSSMRGFFFFTWFKLHINFKIISLAQIKLIFVALGINIRGILTSSILYTSNEFDQFGWSFILNYPLSSPVIKTFQKM